MIEFIGVTKAYSGKAVVDNFSLSLKSGEKIALMGESGSGKTTILRMAAGLISQDSGKIISDKKIAYMFQEPRLLPWKTAKDNILAVLRKDTSLANKYLDLVKLTDASDKYPRELSGGMSQRVSFARFLAYAEEDGSELLLLDEPFSALDGELADQMMKILLDFAQDKTVIFVTHSQEQASMLGGKIVSL